ncbi:hypothetical protein [Pedobacter kyonggii]|uniref:Uncharacterized protein n=1 Tax=Pedobacter kyonggii TaxID=1926871 RepID=A0A4V2JHD4_9SPHI|nr:hypothetical protein [Pedobacter kyonggii]TBO45129.1 hypothetical protein EYS08_01995 [Pedobacter kyonggii]
MLIGFDSPRFPSCPDEVSWAPIQSGLGTVFFANGNRPQFNKPDRSGHRTQRGKADGGTFGSDKHRTLLFKKKSTDFSSEEVSLEHRGKNDEAI